VNDSFDNIKHILDNVLGTPKRDYSGSGGWYEYNCPCCADEKGYTDGKYNLAVQIDDSNMWCHCWRCGYVGKLSKLVRDYGTPMDSAALKDEFEAIKSSRMYSLGSLSDDDVQTLQFEELQLPKGCQPLETGKYNTKANEYLDSRSVGKDIREKFKIGFVGPFNGKYSERIVIPSYDMYGNLNYWVARDYTGNAKCKIYNPNVDKKSIVFNEGLVNWYEPITLVEGPFDHIVVPNSIPLLGKSIDEESAVYKALLRKSHSKIIIMLDDDAKDNAMRMYKFLDIEFKGRVRIIDCPDGYDASDYYRDFGKSGIISLMRSAHKLDDYTLATIS
jgi:hypothetical protein